MFKKTLLIIFAAMMFNIAATADDKNGDEGSKEQQNGMKILWIF